MGIVSEGLEAVTKGSRNMLGGMFHSLFTGRGTRQVLGTKIAREGFGDLLGMGSAGSVTAYAAKGPLLGKGIGTLSGAFLKKFAPMQAASSGIDYFLNETRAGEELSGAARLGIGAVGLGFKLNAYRHLARGATGSVLQAAGRTVGDPSKFINQYRWVEGKLNAIPGLLGKGIAKAAVGAVALPVRAVLGAPYAAMSAARVAGTVGGSALFGRWSMMGSIGGAAARKVGLGGVANKFFNFMESRSVSAALHPTWGGPVGLGRTKYGMKAAPLLTGTVGISAAAAMASKMYSYKQQNDPWVMNAQGGTNPSNYGMGMSVMRRGPSRNYGPALTLMLHQNHSRVMP